MRIEQEVLEWADSRTNWQRVAIRRILAGEILGATDFESIADRLVRDGWEQPDALHGVKTEVREVDGQAVSLVSVGKAVHCNALSPDQVLDFAPSGITIIYGDNGSGKSGYARLIKRIVGARHQEEVLSNVFQDDASTSQSADVAIDVGGTPITFAWPNATASEIRQIKFFDQSCSETFLARETEVTYRPPGLFVMDELIRVCDGVREVLEKRLQRIRDDEPDPPPVAEGTKAFEFLRSLSGKTTKEDIDAACAVPSNIDELVQAARAEEDRLRAGDPFREQQRLQAKAARLRQLAEHLRACEAALGSAVAGRVEALHRDVEAKQTAVRVASSTSFDAEPLAGVGDAAWASLWDAARKYSTTVAYPGKNFPNTEGDARCVLCQQQLAEEATRRVQRFETFVRAEAQRSLKEVEQKKDAAVTALTNFVPRSVDALLAVEFITVDHSEQSASVTRWLEGYEARRQDILACGRGERLWAELTQVEGVDGERLITLAARLEQEATRNDPAAYGRKLAAAVLDRTDLESRNVLSEHREVIEAEVKRCAEREAIEAAKRLTATTGISKKATELTRKYSSVATRDRFTRESDRLRLERVTLEDRGGEKGSLQQKPAFVGAVQSAPLRAVLSEGEQTALGLAGFFTDVVLSTTRSAIVLDDPVTSLDHVRRAYVAERLVKFAAERQVVVFTHDVSFVVDLRAAAEREEVTVTERAIERKGTGDPGVCRNAHPWKAKDVAARLQKLRIDLASIRKSQPAWDQEQYEKACADWAGSLSETWERMVAQEVVGAVVDRGSLEVRPRMFRMLAQITEQDDTEFQTSYAKVSRWARRHDKSTELNYTAPDFAEMESELGLVETWFKRIKGYKK